MNEHTNQKKKDAGKVYDTSILILPGESGLIKLGAILSFTSLVTTRLSARSIEPIQGMRICGCLAC